MWLHGPFYLKVVNCGANPKTHVGPEKLRSIRDSAIPDDFFIHII